MDTQRMLGLAIMVASASFLILQFGVGVNNTHQSHSNPPVPQQTHTASQHPTKVIQSPDDDDREETMALSLEDVERQLADNPYSVDLYVKQSQLHADAKEWDSAIESIKIALGIMPKSLELQMKHIRLYLKKEGKGSRTAEDMLDEMMRKHNSYAPAFKEYGKIRIFHGWREEGLKAIIKASKINPEEVRDEDTIEVLVDCYLYMGWEAWDDGLPQQSAYFYESVLRLDSTENNAVFGRGRAMLDMDEEEEGLAHMALAVKNAKNRFVFSGDYILELVKRNRLAEAIEVTTEQLNEYAAAPKDKWLDEEAIKELYGAGVVAAIALRNYNQALQYLTDAKPVRHPDPSWMWGVRAMLSAHGYEPEGRSVGWQLEKSRKSLPKHEVHWNGFGAALQSSLSAAIERLATGYADAQSENEARLMVDAFWRIKQCPLVPGPGYDRGFPVEALRAMTKEYPEYAEVMPTTYLLYEAGELEAFLAESSAGWIVKPRTYSSESYRYVDKASDVHTVLPDGGDGEWVAQRFVEEPFLAIPRPGHAYKVDLDLQVVVTSIKPLQLFVESRGLLRTAATEWKNRVKLQSYDMDARRNVSDAIRTWYSAEAPSLHVSHRWRCGASPMSSTEQLRDWMYTYSGDYSNSFNDLWKEIEDQLARYFIALTKVSHGQAECNQIFLVRMALTKNLDKPVIISVRPWNRPTKGKIDDGKGASCEYEQHDNTFKWVEALVKGGNSKPQQSDKELVQKVAKKHGLSQADVKLMEKALMHRKAGTNHPFLPSFPGYMKPSMPMSDLVSHTNSPVDAAFAELIAEMAK